MYSVFAPVFHMSMMLPSQELMENCVLKLILILFQRNVGAPLLPVFNTANQVGIQTNSNRLLPVIRREDDEQLPAADWPCQDDEQLPGADWSCQDGQQIPSDWPSDDLSRGMN